MVAQITDMEGSVMTHIPMLCRLLVLAAILAGGVAGAGCGDSSDDGAKASVARSPAEQELLDANDRLTQALYSGDADAYCSGVTAASRRSHARALNQGCEKLVVSIARFVKKKRGSSANIGRPKVVGVKVEGNRGIITTRSSSDGTADDFVYVRRDGRWLSDVRAPADGRPQGRTGP